MTLPQRIRQRTINRRRNINMKKRPIKPLHNRDPIRTLTLNIPLRTSIRLTFLKLFIQTPLIARLRLRKRSFDIITAHLRESALYMPILSGFSSSGCGLRASDFSNGENGFPAVDAARVGLGGVVAEACGGEGALGPAVVDVAEVPVDCVWGGVFVELVADVDEVLDRG